MLHIQRHIFGSYKGYRTLGCSEDLLEQERKKLEIFSFGQTSSLEYLDSLKNNPAFLMRPISESKYGLTRVFKGPLDDHKRSTLLFMTAVISKKDWVEVLKCDFSLLLKCEKIWKWNKKENFSIDIDIPSSEKATSAITRQKVLSLLYLIEQKWNDSNTCILTDEHQCDLKTMRFLNMVLPLSASYHFSFAHRALNDAVPVFFINMSLNGNRGNCKKDKVTSTNFDSIWDTVSYTSYIENIWKPEQELPINVIKKIKDFSYSFPGTTSEAQNSRQISEEVENMHFPVNKKRIWTIVFLIIILVSFSITIFTAKSYLSNQKEKQEIEASILNVQKYLSELEQPNHYRNPANLNEIIKQLFIKRESLQKVIDTSIENETLNNLKFQVNAKLKTFMEFENIYKRFENLKKRFDYQVHHIDNVNYYYEKPIIEELITIEEEIQSLTKDGKKTLDRKSSMELTHFSTRITDVKTSLRMKLDELNSNLFNKNLINPINYDELLLEKYNEKREQIEQLLGNKSLSNALESPIELDRKEAEKIKSNSKSQLSICNDYINDLQDYKDKAQDLVQEVSKRLKDPNISDGNTANIEKFVEINNMLEEAEKYWPTKNEIEQLAKNNSTCFEENHQKLMKHLNQIEDCEYALLVYNENIEELEKVSDNLTYMLEDLENKQEDLKSQQLQEEKQSREPENKIIEPNELEIRIQKKKKINEADDWSKISLDKVEDIIENFPNENELEEIESDEEEDLCIKIKDLENYKKKVKDYIKDIESYDDKDLFTNYEFAFNKLQDISKRITKFFEEEYIEEFKKKCKEE